MSSPLAGAGEIRLNPEFREISHKARNRPAIPATWAWSLPVIPATRPIPRPDGSLGWVVDALVLPLLLGVVGLVFGPAPAHATPSVSLPTHLPLPVGRALDASFLENHPQGSVAQEPNQELWAQRRVLDPANRQAPPDPVLDPRYLGPRSPTLLYMGFDFGLSLGKDLNVPVTVIASTGTNRTGNVTLSRLGNTIIYGVSIGMRIADSVSIELYGRQRNIGKPEGKQKLSQFVGVAPSIDDDADPTTPEVIDPSFVVFPDSTFLLRDFGITATVELPLTVSAAFRPYVSASVGSATLQLQGDARTRSASSLSYSGELGLRFAVGDRVGMLMGYRAFSTQPFDFDYALPNSRKGEARPALLLHEFAARTQIRF